MKREATVILAIAVIALLIGQIVSYYGSSSDFSISTSEDGGTIDYTVRSGPDVEYTELHLDNGVKAPTKFYVLRDDSYPISADRSSIGPTCYFLESAFDKCRSISMEYRNVQEILEMMEEDLITGTPDTGIIILGGALPQPWYDGTISSRIIQWMNIGGSVYWGGDLFGRYISTPDGIVTVEDYHTTVCNSLFGTEHLSIENRTNIKFDIDEMRFKLADKKQSKATNSQVIELTPAMTLENTTSFKYGYRNVVVLKKMTFPNDKVLTIELSEKQISGRTISLNIDYEDVLSADSFNHLMLKEE